MKAERSMHACYAVVAFASVISMVFGFHLARGENFYALCAFAVLWIASVVFNTYLAGLAAKAKHWEELTE